MNKENKKIALISEDQEVIDAINKAVGEIFDINVFSNGIIFYNQLEKLNSFEITSPICP